MGDFECLIDADINTELMRYQKLQAGLIIYDIDDFENLVSEYGTIEERVVKGQYSRISNYLGPGFFYDIGYYCKNCDNMISGPPYLNKVEIEEGNGNPVYASLEHVCTNPECNSVLFERVYYHREDYNYQL